jgi:hypothetical protein
MSNNGGREKMLKKLEHLEHASHIAHSGEHEHDTAADVGEQHTKQQLFSAQMAALLVAALAAGLALSEQGAKHAEIKVQADLVGAADAWSQFQGKSTRALVSKDTLNLMAVLEPSSDPDVMDRRKSLETTLNADRERYVEDPKDGQKAIAERAHGLEEARDHALEQTHAYHNGCAAMELGIVLATASAIINSRALILTALGLGVVGTLCSVAAYFAPEWGAF